MLAWYGWMLLTAWPKRRGRAPDVVPMKSSYDSKQQTGFDCPLAKLIVLNHFSSR